MIRTSTAVWRGDCPQGKGTVTMQSGVLREQPFSFYTRFESGNRDVGTNPEELLGAAHASCYAMALAFALTEVGRVPSELEVSAAVEIERIGDGFSIRSVVLSLQARVPGLDLATFQSAAEGAKKACPLSKALAGTSISLSAKLT